MSTVSQALHEGWSGISLYWEVDEAQQQITVALQGPSFHLRNFASPSDLLERFLFTVRASGIDLSTTDSVRARIDAVNETFSVRWNGTLRSDPSAVAYVMKALALDLGLHEL